MTKLAKLKASARQSAVSRGHPLSNFKKVGPHTYGAGCPKCGVWVQIDTDPPPNGIDISGPAVARNCPVFGLSARALHFPLNGRAGNGLSKQEVL